MSEFNMGFMVVNKILGFFVLFLILGSSVFAFSVDAPSELVVSNKPVRVSFLIENPSGFDKDFSIDYSFPSQVIEDYVPREISGGNFDKVILTILPSEELVNSSYIVKVKFELGSDLVEKTLTIKYVKLEETKNSEVVSNDSNVFSGLIGLVSLNGINLTDFLINLFLFLIVAVLMISFISRLVVFLDSRNKTNSIVEEEEHALTPSNPRLNKLRKSVLEGENE